MSSRGAITFDRLREVQVEVAVLEGIALTGTTRLSRGVHDCPVPDAEYRRARAKGREAVPPAHTEASAIATAAEILDYARDYRGAATVIAEQAPELAERLEAAAATILAGRTLAVEREAAPRITPQEAMRMAETIEKVQAEVRQNFVELEADIRSVENPAKRAEFLHDLAGLKAEAASFIRDDIGLQGYRADALHLDYRGLVVSVGDARAAAIRRRPTGRSQGWPSGSGCSRRRRWRASRPRRCRWGSGVTTGRRSSQSGRRGVSRPSGSTRSRLSSPTSITELGPSTARRRSGCATSSARTRVAHRSLVRHGTPQVVRGSCAARMVAGVELPVERTMRLATASRHQKGQASPLGRRVAAGVDDDRSR